jgi:putative ATP-dependent endonuclease of OLD family
MKLDKISIRNFKSIASGSFEPSKFSCLVGENNAGKSTVMQAIVNALNRPSQLALSNFYDPENPVIFELRFSGVDKGHLARLAEDAQSKISDLVTDGIFSLQVLYAPNEKVTVEALQRVPIDSRYRSEKIDAAFLKKKGQVAIEEVITNLYPEFKDLQNESLSTINAAKEWLTTQIDALADDQFTMSYRPLPTGIPASIAPLLPEPIYIPAVKNLNDDLKTTQSTSFGRLLVLLLEDMTEDLEAIKKSLQDFNALFNRVKDEDGVIDNRNEKVRLLEGDVEEFLGENFSNVKIQLHIPPPDLKTILNAAQIYVDDGSYDLIDNKGDGIKRLLMFALLQAYVKRLARSSTQAPAVQGATNRPLLFLFEEPELYLHPRSQRVLFGTLADIANAHQVVVTTHSPIFFEPSVTASFVRVAKQPALPKPVATLHPVNFEKDEEATKIFRLARFEYADAAFFSQAVVLFEGESDDTYCRHVAKVLDPTWDFDRHNIALVRVSGKGNFAKFRAFFEKFGITVKVVADLDAIFDGFDHLGANEAARELRCDVIRKLDEQIEALQLEADLSKDQIKKRVEKGAWRDTYFAVRKALLEIQSGATVDQKTNELIDSLFAWEKGIKRQQICKPGTEAAAALVPLLDSLREQGICVLARGAIEDYYPGDVAANSSKPDRALRACDAVTTKARALALSSPLAEGRDSELEEVFRCLFAETPFLSKPQEQH